MSITNRPHTKVKILIAGIGGVGGFFGGLLAKEFYESDKVDIYFLARGSHLEEIRKNGLTVKHEKNEFTVHPTLATDIASEIGTVDYIILSTKSFDLEKVCHQINPCLTLQTVVLPLLNGVSNSLVIRKIIPNNVVLMGCVYIIASKVEDGKVENKGNIQSLYLGLDNIVDKRFNLLESLFKTAAIDATLSSTISSIIWEKYIFLSSLATATSYFDCTVGGNIENEQKYKALTELVKEVRQVALSNNVVVDKDFLTLTLKKIKSLPAHITSSLHRDFQSGKSKTELDSLTGYVVNESANKNLEAPNFEHMFMTLQAKNSKRIEK